MTTDQKSDIGTKKRNEPARRKSPRTSRQSESKPSGHVVIIHGVYPAHIKASERPLALVGVGIDPYEQAQAASTGLKTLILKRLQEKGWISSTEVRVIVDPRTLSHRISKNQPLSVEEADKAIRVARLLEKALVVFGTQEKVMNWWRRPSPRFGKSSPVELAKTEHGGRLVEEALVQIDEGMFA